MKSTLVASLVLALFLSGCSSFNFFKKKNTDTEQNQQPLPQLETSKTPYQVTVAKFECNNGLSVTVKNVAEDKIYLTTQKYSATMSLAPSGSGERYIASQGLYGYGGEWHQKGDEAIFSYKGVHGKDGETSCNIVH